MKSLKIAGLIHEDQCKHMTRFWHNEMVKFFVCNTTKETDIKDEGVIHRLVFYCILDSMVFHL